MWNSLQIFKKPPRIRHGKVGITSPSCSALFRGGKYYPFIKNRYLLHSLIFDKRYMKSTLPESDTAKSNKSLKEDGIVILNILITD